MEIEAPTWEEVNKATKLLGLNPEDKRIFSTYQIYQLKGIEENDYQVLTFEVILPAGVSPLVILGQGVMPTIPITQTQKP